MGIFIGSSPFEDAESFEYFRNAVFGSYGDYACYTYIEEQGSWVFYVELCPEVVMTYRLNKGSAEETVFLAEKDAVDSYIPVKRLAATISR